ncbi:Hypothetical protein HDN1F_23570 [gamma proteobacterium HdN1]|nr:Hypothetical protein HDN1F_23570 [gamma proteobacterium HdN1]
MQYFQAPILAIIGAWHTLVPSKLRSIQAALHKSHVSSKPRFIKTVSLKPLASR